MLFSCACAVRLCSDREQLVTAAIECSPSSCLQYWWRVMQLAHLLRVPGDKSDREAMVLVLLAAKAMQVSAACHVLGLD